MHILIAPNAFKNSLPAAGAATAIQKGLLKSGLHCTCECFPVGDGGDGTGELIIQHDKGIVIPVEVHDPLGRRINSSFGLIDDGKTAVIEMANASGLRLLNRSEYDPLHTSSFGTGELMTHALNKNVSKLILCIGGSATVDGGTGMAQAIGIRFLDKEDNELRNLPGQLTQLYSIDLSMIDKRIFDSHIIILCDVENPLLGKQGAAAVFGPQKGARADDIIKLEAGLTTLRDVVLKYSGKDISALKYGGAAGGVAAGLYALLNAELVNGIEQFLLLTHFENALDEADIVITGEGSIDMQTLQGKGPYGVAKLAKQKNKLVIGVAGQVPKEIPAELKNYFDHLISINEEPFDITLALQNTAINLERTAEKLGEMLGRKNSL
ncbi:MAG TPA: glycerate kinase [Chitinophagaceae bacterium]|nr:glycerate kinase [Chitinophagaceae bacterium]